MYFHLKKRQAVEQGVHLRCVLRIKKSVFLTFYVGRQQILFNRGGTRDKNKQEHMGTLVKKKCYPLCEDLAI